MDGVPVSKNSDLQFEKPRGTLLSVSSGIDLRVIPADNIETIEVLSGMPSVKYGDFTEGIINIKTKTGLQPHRLKIKDNPDTREANFGGSWGIFKNGLSYNLNLARSERDVRVKGDEYTRISAQTSYFSQHFDNSMNINQKLNIQGIYDEEQPEGDVHKIINYNRGFTIGYTGSGSYLFSKNKSSLDFNLFATMQRENSMKSRLVQSDLRVLPNGDTVAAYIGKVENRGIEWTAGGKFDWYNTYYTGGFNHELVFGTEVQYNANTGDGIMFDTVYSYYGPDAGRRPYSFSSIPGQTLLSFYAEDQISGNLFFDFKLTIGARYDTYRPYQFNLKGLWGDGNLIRSHQGSFFNPRINAIVFLSDYNQMRISAGRTSKSPAMGLIYPPEEVFRWRNPETSVINHLRYDQSSPDLKGITEDQIEISYDQKFFDDIAATFTFFYKERINETKEFIIPVFYISDAKKVFYIDNYSKQINSGWNITKGMEVIFKTNRIRALNMNFQISGSYNHLNGSPGNYRFKINPDLTKGQYPNYEVMDTLVGFVYPNLGKWNDRIQLNYYIKYTLPPLGLWVSLRAEQIIGEREQNYNLEPEDYNLLTESGKTAYLLKRQIRSRGQKWVLNLNISKSLYKGAEISFYVNNFLDDPGFQRLESSPGFIIEISRNPVLFYGIEFSTILDELFK